MCADKSHMSSLRGGARVEGRGGVRRRGEAALFARGDHVRDVGGVSEDGGRRYGAHVVREV